ncbi:MAG: SusC/RagA family TonB-linked outer membrane protein [Prevotellaceae bacterium]|jgi:TonB-linked SusC/RagA family outer membrane protein|nr:SusC/RagA family TonB-linked outer membrane protein [Prevotellaceae bacterium]
MKKKGILILSLILIISTSPLQTMGQSLNQQITFELQNQSLDEGLQQLGKISGFRMAYSSQLVLKYNNISIEKGVRTVQAILDLLLANTNLRSIVQDTRILIVEKEKEADNNPATQVVSGRVTNSRHEPLQGVTVSVKNTARGTVTDNEGKFVIVSSENDEVLSFSIIGFITRELTVNESLSEIILEEKPEELENVVVTGIFTRRSESFTGSAQTFTQDDLRKVGNLNVIQSLKNIDPSFHIMDNILDGSNPNVMPEIQLRGQSGFPDLRGEYRTDPNQPLFVLDGFEVGLTKVIDLDMNRVESVTLLKDAAAKAIYGSKAANGVVVIETHRPKAGKLRSTYTGSLNISIPDLTSYNLTNAAEKLQVEKDAGLFAPSGSSYEFADRQYEYDLEYNRILEDVLRGVNTDWLAQPLRAGLGEKHAVYIEGGDDYLRYGVDFSYNNVKGVMKGSDRNTISGAMTLSYRYKNILLRDNLEYTYNKGLNSPWGDFGAYAGMNPYFTPTDENGRISKIAGSTLVTGIVGNPMWNSTINTKDFSEYSQITNNFYIEWFPVDGLKVTGRLGVSRNDSGHEIFHPASHTDFIGYTSEADIERKGQYIYGDGADLSLSSDINVSYSKTINKHLFFTNIGSSISNASTRYLNYMTEGFPNDYLDDITFARQYVLNSRPSGSENTSRDVSMLAFLNYAYDDRYLLDASLRESASSEFGRDNRWGNFWSVGLGWNAHNEKFIQQLKFFDQFRIRGSIGFTGSQGFNSSQSKTTFSYTSNSTYLGHHGAYLLGIENSALKWQRKYDQNVGADISILNKRVTVRWDYYRSVTDDLLTDVTIPSSTGFRSYKENLGETQNIGQEFRISYRVWSNPKNKSFLNLYVTGIHNKNTVKKISNSLATYNEEQIANSTNKPIVRYIEGQSISAIWAVPSYGIDPASGREIFIRQDGNIVHTWNSDDLTVCGDSEATVRGNCGFNVDYKGFSLNVGANWRLGGQVYNQTLVDKIENADLTRNVDRRVFSNRWREPGDVSQFKNITNKAITRATQRFVEDRNEWLLSSLNFSYDFGEIAAIQRIGFHRFRLSFDMNDVARVSSVKIERGTSYPFARSFSLSLQAMF